MKPIAKVYTGLIFLFLFAPIIILLVFSVGLIGEGLQRRDKGVG